MNFNIPKRESVMGEVGLTLATDFSIKGKCKFSFHLL